MDEEIKTGEMTGEIDESITVEEDFTLLEGKAVSITDDSDNKTNEDEVYEEALEIKESLDDIRQQIKDKLLDILEKGRITDADGCEIELLNDQYTEKYNELKDVANTVIPGGKGASTSTTNTSTTDTTEIVKVNIDYDEILKTINEKADWLYIDEDGTVMLNGEVVPKLKVVELEAEKIKADVGEFKNLTAENFQAVNAKIDNLEVTDLTAVNADITNLKALVAEIQTLIGGNLTMDNIQSLVLTSDKVTIANALIKNAMIDSISANKINTGTINTNNVNIQSADGSMLINGTTQQFKDKNGKVRIQIGKDAQGNFTFALFSQDGVGVLIDEKGIKSGAVPNGIIVNDMVADNANISGGKLDINSVITSINNGTEVIKGTRIQLDEQGQSLQVAFNQLKSKVETIENVTIDGDLSSVIEQVSSNTTDISVMQGQISSLISNTTITKQDGTVTQLKDEFNSVKNTVTSHTQTINSHESTLTSVSAKQSKFQQDLNGFKQTVSNTYQTKDGMNNYATKSELQQTATDLTATFNNGYTQGVTQMNADGIKVYHNQISGENYTHMSPAGFYIKYKGEDLLICDSNGLTYKGTITGSTITGGTIRGTEVIGGSLNVEGTLTANRIVCQDIDNAKYPATLDGNLEIYVNSSTGNDDNEPDDDVRFKTLQGAIDAIPKFLNGKTVYITLETNTTEDVYLRGFVGGAIRIYLNGKTLFGTLRTYVCSCSVTTYGGTKDNTEGTVGIIHPNVGLSFGSRAVSVGFEASQYCALYKVKVYAPDNIPSGVSSTEKVCVASQAGTGSVYCKNVEIVNATVGFRSNNHGSMHVNSSSGVASKYGFQSTTGGIISIANNNQCGGKTSATNKSGGGQIWYEDGKPTFATGNQSSDDTTAPVAPTTKTMTIKSTYGDTYRSSVYNSWKKDGTARQGDYGYGDCSGLWFFGTAFSELKGKTITKVEITITRNSGGSSSPVGLVVRTHNYSARPSGAPKLSSSSYGTLSLATGETDKLTITHSDVLNGIKNGTVKGFGIRTTYDASHYAVCSGSVTVKITYTE